LPDGTIIKGIGGFYYVKADEKIYECKARGIFRKDAVTPLSGDSVKISVINEEKKLGNIDEILTRSIELVRPAVANVNQIVIVIAIKSPQPDMALLDKLLITAGLKDIDAVICINKIDLDDENEFDKISEIYSKAGYKVILTSSKTNHGFEDLLKILEGKITAFAGQSGVGKSTILNFITQSMAMQTGEVSRKLERGKHTTRHAELIELKNGGYVVDTPGFSSYELDEVEFDHLELYYPEFSNYLNKCRFTWCSHISEPECAIKEALGNGDIDKSRYDRYVQFYTDLKSNKEYRSKDAKVKK